ncbi:MAG: hypothetical protein ACFFG0_40010 [Candidatus Thorarchaeota archaeon]
MGSYTQISLFVNSVDIQIETKHSGLGELSERINNDERAQQFYEVNNILTEIFRSEIIECNFKRARSLLSNLLIKPQFDTIKKLYGQFRV